MSWSQTPNMRTIFRDFQWQEPHPRDWIPVASRDLEDHEIHQVADWLHDCCQGRWSDLTHYCPGLRKLIYFERMDDAMHYRLAWG